MAACLLALLLAGCGSSDDPPAAEPDPASSETQPEQSAVPPDEPPVTEEGGPPPAWIETQSGSAWMAYGRYLWGGISVESARVTCDDSAVPQLDLASGDTVRFHLEFLPETAELTLGADGSRPEVVTLEPARVIEWQGDYHGALWLALTAPEGEVAYVACANAVS